MSSEDGRWLRALVAANAAPPGVGGDPSIDARWLSQLVERARQMHLAKPKPGSASRAGSANLGLGSNASPSDEESPAIWRAGDVIGNLYEVRGVLGEGGMGTVFKVWHRGWALELAVKSPKPASLGRAGAQAFVRECETWVNLGLHPHVVSCYYVRTMGGIPRVFAEYIAGGSLADWIRTGRLYDGGVKASLRRILDIAIQFAWGLDYAHEQGLVHQDVKPANVMVTHEGVVKITDFGVSRARGKAPAESEHSTDPRKSVLVTTGGMTPAYCSPEQSARRPLSRKTDIWSYGLSVVEMFAGEVTWVAGQLAALVLEDLTTSSSDDVGRLPRIPDPVGQLLQRCFADEPSVRPASMAAIADELTVIYQSLVAGSYPRSRPSATELMADSLNNRALSNLDLGNANEAQAAWERALSVDPLHLESIYNHGLARWRSGDQTDARLLARLALCSPSPREPWLRDYLVGRIHLERGDPLAARAELARIDQSLYAEAQALISPLRLPDVLPPATFGEGAKQDHACLSPSGRFAATQSDKRLMIWNTRSMACVRDITGLADFNQLLLLMDGEEAVALTIAQTHHTVRRWDLVSGRCLWMTEIPRAARFKDLTLGGEDRGGPTLCVSSDGSTVIAFPDAQASVLDGRTGQLMGKLAGVDANVYNVGLSEDGLLAIVLLGTHSSTKMGIWEVPTLQRLRWFQRDEAGLPLHHMRSAAICTRIGKVMTGDADSNVRVWDMATGFLERELTGNGGGVQSVSMTADGALALSTAGDRTIRLWDVARGRCLRTMTLPFEPSSAQLDLGGRMALAAFNGTKPTRLPISDCLPAPARVSRLAATEDVDARALQAREWLRQANQAMTLGRFGDALGFAQRVRATMGWERAADALVLWRRLSTHCRRTRLRGLWPVETTGLTEPVSSAAMTPDGRWLLTGDAVGRMHLSDLTGEHADQAVRGASGRISAVSLSFDGRYALTSAVDGLRLWDAKRLRQRRTFEIAAHLMDNTARAAGPPVQLSPDGRFALAGPSDKILIWDTTSGRLVRTLSGSQSAPVAALSITSDNQTIVSADTDDVVRIWDFPSGACLRTLTLQPHPERPATDPLHRAEWLERTFSCRRSITLAADMRSFLYSSATRVPVRITIATGGTLSISDDLVPFVGTFSADARCVLIHATPTAWTAQSGLSQRALVLWEAGIGVIAQFGQSSERATHVLVSEDMRTVLAAFQSAPPQRWHLDWDLESEATDHWEEQLQPHLEAFLRVQARSGRELASAVPADKVALEQSLRRSGPAHWNEAAFSDLVASLGRLGLGFVRPSEVRARVDQLVSKTRAVKDATSPPDEQEG